MKPTPIVSVDSYDWTDILRESQAEGHNMVQRLLADFASGRNRFDASGEVFYAHFSGQVVIAVGGLNQETDQTYPSAGRIRRLYVLPEARGKGLARTLVEALMRYAFPHFDTLTVNVGKLDARGFYEHVGFQPVQHPRITHYKRLLHNQVFVV